MITGHIITAQNLFCTFVDLCGPFSSCIATVPFQLLHEAFLDDFFYFKFVHLHRFGSVCMITSLFGIHRSTKNALQLHIAHAMWHFIGWTNLKKGLGRRGSKCLMFARYSTLAPSLFFCGALYFSALLVREGEYISKRANERTNERVEDLCF